MLMGPNDGCVDHRVFVVRILAQMLQNLLPHAALRPARKPRMHHAEVPEPLRKVSPWNTRSITVQNRFHKQPVVSRRTAFRPYSPWQQILDPLPLIIPQSVTTLAHPSTIKTLPPQAYSEFDDTP